MIHEIGPFPSLSNIRRQIKTGKEQDIFLNQTPKHLRKLSVKCENIKIKKVMGFKVRLTVCTLDKLLKTLMTYEQGRYFSIKKKKRQQNTFYINRETFENEIIYHKPVFIQLFNVLIIPMFYF